MANVLYDKGRQKFLEGAIAWLTDTIKVTLIDMDDYPAFDPATDEFYDDIPAAAKVQEGDAALGSKTSTDGVADAADVVFTAVTGDEVEAIVIWSDTGTPATSPLIAHIDTATGLPLTPNGGDVNLIWDSGVNRIFKL